MTIREILDFLAESREGSCLQRKQKRRDHRNVQSAGAERSFEGELLYRG